MRMEITALRYGDNFIYLLQAGRSAAAVDPGAARPVAEALSAAGRRLELILLTHQHADHTGGVAELKRALGCRVAGPPGGRPADTAVQGGETLAFAGVSIEVLSVPGHTANDVAFHVPAESAVFTGDTLFAAGCGRVLSGRAELMWDSLRRLAALPDGTRVFGGHDYTLENLEFAAFIDPANAAVRERLGALRRRAAEGRAFEPSTIAEERRTNPFLRCRDAAEFARLRARKDAW